MGTNTKTQTLPERAQLAGTNLARRIFDKRSEGRNYRTSEAHLSEKELAAFLALAYERGAKEGAALDKLSAPKLCEACGEVLLTSGHCNNPKCRNAFDYPNPAAVKP